MHWKMSKIYAAMRNDSIEADTLKSIALKDVFVKAERGISSRRREM